MELDLPILRVTNKTTTRMGMTDTGAQMVVGDMALVHSLGKEGAHPPGQQGERGQ